MATLRDILDRPLENPGTIKAIYAGGPGSGRHKILMNKLSDTISQARSANQYKLVQLLQKIQSHVKNSGQGTFPSSLDEKLGNHATKLFRTGNDKLVNSLNGLSHHRDDLNAGGPGSGVYDHHKTVSMMKQKGFKVINNNPYSTVGNADVGFSHKDGGYYNVDRKTGQWDFGRGDKGTNGASGEDGKSLYRHVNRNYGG